MSVEKVERNTGNLKMCIYALFFSHTVYFYQVVRCFFSGLPIHDVKMDEVTEDCIGAMLQTARVQLLAKMLP